jgi:hypothetical protein
MYVDLRLGVALLCAVVVLAKLLHDHFPDAWEVFWR